MITSPAHTPIGSISGADYFLARVKADGSFVDESKIVLRRVEVAIGALLTLLILLALLKRFRADLH
jgi:hypothetical protein